MKKIILLLAILLCSLCHAEEQLNVILEERRYETIQSNFEVNTKVLIPWAIIGTTNLDALRDLMWTNYGLHSPYDFHLISFAESLLCEYQIDMNSIAISNLSVPSEIVIEKYSDCDDIPDDIRIARNENTKEAIFSKNDNEYRVTHTYNDDYVLLNREIYINNVLSYSESRKYDEKGNLINCNLRCGEWGYKCDWVYDSEGMCISYTRYLMKSDVPNSTEDMLEFSYKRIENRITECSIRGSDELDIEI